MKLSNKDILWLIIRSLVLPLMFILPYFTDHFYQYACPESPQIDYVGPCYAIGTNIFTAWLALPLIIIGVVLLFSVRATQRRGKDRAEFAKFQLYLALIIVTATILVHAILYQFSEGKLLGLIQPFEPPSQEILNKIEAKSLGVSFSPQTVIFVGALYLIAPLWQWVSLTKDRSRIVGIKKGELFK